VHPSIEGDPDAEVEPGETCGVDPHAGPAWRQRDGTQVRVVELGREEGFEARGARDEELEAAGPRITYLRLRHAALSPWLPSEVHGVRTEIVALHRMVGYRRRMGRLRASRLQRALVSENRMVRTLGWSVRFLALGALYFFAGTAAVLMVGATVVLPGALIFGLMEPASHAAGPTVLMLLPSFAALFAAMSGLLRTVESAESSLSWSELLASRRKERAAGQLSMAPGHREQRGRLSLVDLEATPHRDMKSLPR
jgi:hypothetical protein